MAAWLWSEGERLMVMDLFFREARAAQAAHGAKTTNGNQQALDRPKRPRSGRIAHYGVRVRDDFKSDVMGLVAELQLERQRASRLTRRVTEGEVMELMLHAFKTLRRNGEAAGYAVPVANVVWQGVHEIARARKVTPEEALEQLVVDKIAELGLVPVK